MIELIPNTQSDPENAGDSTESQGDDGGSVATKSQGRVLLLKAMLQLKTNSDPESTKVTNRTST